MVPFVAGSVHWNYGDHVPFRKLAFEKAEMVRQILKRDGAEEFHFIIARQEITSHFV